MPKPGPQPPPMGRPGRRPSAPSPDTLNLLGRIAYLLAFSDLHRGYTIDAVERYFLPGIYLDQFRYYENRNQPEGFVCWAWLTDEASEAYINQTRPIDPVEWNQGRNLWFMEFVAPFGSTKAILHDMRANILPRARGRSIRRTSDGTVKKIARYVGYEARQS